MQDEWVRSATVNRVVDADTLDVDVDLGFTVSVGVRVRLNGIQAPELRTSAGYSARGFVTDILKVGDTVTIRTFKTEKFGRYLADVLVGEGKQSLAALLIEAGHAVAWDGKGSRPVLGESNG